jgi:uncharacterized protein
MRIRELVKACSLACVLLAGSARAEGEPPAPAGDAQADEAAPAIDPEKAADIRRLLELTGSAALGKQVAAQMLVSLRKMAPEVPAEFWQEFERELRFDEVIELVVPIYDRHLSRDDVRELIRFYESPTGRKLISVMPVVLRDCMAVGQEWGRQVAERALLRARERKLTDKTL